MAQIVMDFESATLGFTTEITVLLPTKSAHGPAAGRRPEGFPVLWLLHGGGDNHSAWVRWTSLERYAKEAGVAVILPSANGSMYANMVHGRRYFDYITGELVELCRDTFPLSPLRRHNVLAGNSMGGYGALKAAFSFPERYAAAGVFSSGNFPLTDFSAGGMPPHLQATFAANNLTTFGTETLEEVLGTENDVFWLADRAAAAGSALPAVWHACGTEDPWLPQARATRDGLADRVRSYHYSESPGGHSWDFWDDCLKRYLRWLAPLLEDKPEDKEESR